MPTTEDNVLTAPREQPGAPIEPSETTDLDGPKTKDQIHNLLDMENDMKKEIQPLDEIKRQATLNLSSSFRAYDNDFL